MNAFDNYRQMLTTLYGTIPIYLHFAPLTNIQEHGYIVPKSTKDSTKKVEIVKLWSTVAIATVKADLSAD